MLQVIEDFENDGDGWNEALVDCKGLGDKVKGDEKLDPEDVFQDEELGHWDDGETFVLVMVFHFFHFGVDSESEEEFDEGGDEAEGYFGYYND